MIRVLVVEDEALTAEAHADYVRRLDGFELVGIAGSAGAAHAAIVAADPPIDLVLLDLGLPDASGLDLARRLRAEGRGIEIVAITAVRDLQAVQAAVSLGVAQYLIKPFLFDAFRDRLQQVARFRAHLGGAQGAATQSEVDALLSSWRGPARAALPKGLSPASLDAVSATLRSAGAALSATEVASRVDMSRVTARRYLEHLADLGLARRAPRYGGPGRPEVAYGWVS